MDVTYLNFQKAFDKVPQMRLLNKISAHGVKGNMDRGLADWQKAESGDKGVFFRMAACD